MAYACSVVSEGYVSLSGAMGTRCCSASCSISAMCSTFGSILLLFGQKVADQAIERCRMLCLGPVTAVSKDMQLGVWQYVQELLAGTQWNHAVLAPMKDKG